MRSANTAPHTSPRSGRIAAGSSISNPSQAPTDKPSRAAAAVNRSRSPRVIWARICLPRPTSSRLRRPTAGSPDSCPPPTEAGGVANTAATAATASAAAAARTPRLSRTSTSCRSSTALPPFSVAAIALTDVPIRATRTRAVPRASNSGSPTTGRPAATSSASSTIHVASANPACSARASARR